MDKRPVYPGAIPLDLDLLQPQRNVEIALGFLMQAAFGTSTLIDGLAVTQTTVPSMAVKVGPGSVITATTVDTLTSGFGSLAVDNADPLVKMGINLTATTMGALTAPATAGYSVNVLVEAQFVEADGAAVVLPYLNAANPSVPYAGPANTGTASNTARTQTVQLQYKYGVAAASGSQVTPSPDVGWTGVAVVTIANGQSTITNSNITAYVGAAGVTTVPTKLPLLRQQLTANLNLYVSVTGSDSNSGLSASVPFATLQKAWNTIITRYDLNGYAVTVNVANGTYTTGLAASGTPTGGGSVAFVGNVATPSNVTITASNSNAIAAGNGANISVSGFTVAATGTPGASTGCGLLAYQGGLITVTGSMVYSSCGWSHMQASNGGSIFNNGQPYSIIGGAQAHWSSAYGNIQVLGCTVTLTGTPTFSTAFASSTLLGKLECYSCPFSGSASGARYLITTNAILNTAGAGATYLPGSTTGSTYTGGQYI